MQAALIAQRPRGAEAWRPCPSVPRLYPAPEPTPQDCSHALHSLSTPRSWGWMFFRPLGIDSWHWTAYSEGSSLSAALGHILAGMLRGLFLLPGYPAAGVWRLLKKEWRRT